MEEKLIYRDRQGTNAVKWNDLRRAGFQRDDLLGMWVADMDFAAPECVRQALREAADFGVFGYDKAPEAYYEAFLAWEEKYHGYRPERDWLRYSPGVVAGFNYLVRLLTEEGDAVLIQTPVYYPFSAAVLDQGRKLVTCELVNTGGVYTADYEALERAVEENGVKLMILCSPHNPVGRVWTREELLRLLGICRRHGVKVISDEIHHDFEHPGHKHVPTAAAGEPGEFDDLVMTLTAPSKTFNLAGLQNSLVILPDPAVREKYDAFTRVLRVSGGNSLGYVAAAAAYRGGRPWLESVLRTVEDNAALLRRRLAEDLPKAVMSPLVGTYLAWIDLGAYVIAGNIKDIMEGRCGLALDYGSQFGAGAPTHIRVNLATCRENVALAADRLAENLGK